MGSIHSFGLGAAGLTQSESESLDQSLNQTLVSAAWPCTHCAGYLHWKALGDGTFPKCILIENSGEKNSCFDKMLKQRIY